MKLSKVSSSDFTISSNVEFLSGHSSTWLPVTSINIFMGVDQRYMAYVPPKRVRWYVYRTTRKQSRWTMISLALPLTLCRVSTLKLLCLLLNIIQACQMVFAKWDKDIHPSLVPCYCLQTKESVTTPFALSLNTGNFLSLPWRVKLAEQGFQDPGMAKCLGISSLGMGKLWFSQQMPTGAR